MPTTPTRFLPGLDPTASAMKASLSPTYERERERERESERERERERKTEKEKERE